MTTKPSRPDRLPDHVVIKYTRTSALAAAHTAQAGGAYAEIEYKSYISARNVQSMHYVISIWTAKS